MNNIEEHLGMLTAHLAILRAHTSALQETFFAYLAAEHNDKYPNFSTGVKRECADIFGNKLLEYAESISPQYPFYETIQREINSQLDVLRNDFEELERSLNQSS